MHTFIISNLNPGTIIHWRGRRLFSRSQRATLNSSRRGDYRPFIAAGLPARSHPQLPAGGASAGCQGPGAWAPAIASGSGCYSPQLADCPRRGACRPSPGSQPATGLCFPAAVFNLRMPMEMRDYTPQASRTILGRCGPCSLGLRSHCVLSAWYIS